ncbi:hypothetical protein [Enterobacter kobei]|nr:hypothetical protein [Enterobacter kobei]
MALSALKETTGLVKVINDAKNDAEIKAATFELQNKLLMLQSECFSLGDVLHSKNDQIALLHSQLDEFKNFSDQSNGYKLIKLECETIVYAMLVTYPSGGQQVFYACSNCFNKKQLTHLQPKTPSTSHCFGEVFCPSCQNQYLIDKKEYPDF